MREHGANPLARLELLRHELLDANARGDIGLVVLQRLRRRDLAHTEVLPAFPASAA